MSVARYVVREMESSSLVEYIYKRILDIGLQKSQGMFQVPSQSCIKGRLRKKWVLHGLKAQQKRNMKEKTSEG